MKIEFLKSDRKEEFLEYCKKYRGEIDDSFLYDEDLLNFEPNDENPTYIAMNEGGKIVGTVSLIIDDYNRRGKKGRFRIFHSEADTNESYNLLMEAILKHTGDLDNIFVFSPVVNTKLIEAIERLNFSVERYSYLLVREDLEAGEVSLPEDYKINPFKLECDKEKWCEVRNASFAKLKGSETPMTPAMVEKMILSEDNIEGGAMILYHNEKPVGVVRGAIDDYEGQPIMNIGPLAIIPEYQGKGLGRMLLRACLSFAKEKTFKRTILCVNAENERAKALYLQEGFKQVEAAACYKYEI